MPVEVVPFGWETTASGCAALGADPVLRRDAGGQPFRTDGGNLILDCRFGPIDDPAALEHDAVGRDGGGGDGPVHRHGGHGAGRRR